MNNYTVIFNTTSFRTAIHARGCQCTKGKTMSNGWSVWDAQATDPKALIEALKIADRDDALPPEEQDRGIKYAVAACLKKKK